MSDKTLIKGGCVLTLGVRTPNHPEADVLIEDGRIAEVGIGLRARDAQVVDASNTIVMPGFVDTHRHVWNSLLRNAGDEAIGGDSMSSSDRYPASFGEEDVYAATLIGLLGAVEAGITTVVDWSDIDPTDGRVDAALQAHEDAGLRTVFALSSEGASHEEEKAALRRLVARGVAGDATSVAFAPANPSISNLDQVGRDWALARDLELRIHTHVGGDPLSRGVVSELGQRGMLGPDVTLVHCRHLVDADLDAIASHDVQVSLTPASEMAGGYGLPPMQELIDRDIRPGLGVGSERFAPGDIFAQMRAVNSVQHATHFDLKLSGKGGLPNLLTTRDVIRFATVDGARAAGLGHVTGSIEVGKQADIVILRTDRPNIWPINDPIGAVVWGMDTSNVDWVFVDGRVLMRGGALTADVETARRIAITAQQKVAVGASG